jgi:glutamine amidotransferase-like uncharacterized protein
MRKIGAQLAHKHTEVVQMLCTKCMHFLGGAGLSPISRSCAQICTRFIRLVIHARAGKFLGVQAGLYPLSTALIIEHNMDIKG